MLRFRRPSRRVARLAVATAFATAFVAPASASAGVLDSLSGWWPMYEGGGQTVHDLSGRGNHGQLGSSAGADANDPTWIRGFLFGSGLRFDGNDFVRIPDSPALRTPQITVSSWVRASQSPGEYKYILGRGADRCESSSYALYTGETGGLRFYVTDVTGAVRGSDVIPAATIWNGKWHHVAGTWDGSAAKLFVDGRLISSAAGEPAAIDYTLPTAGDTGLGGYLGTCDLYYTGDIDDVAIFSQALPVDQIWSKVAALFTKPLR
ncbi:MAG: hypothetical protein JWR30_2850 [Conexibacter sp.]|jgi:hypothetical protein|nr:hypothetical protein [Conexibacter sp.]MCZ4492085.1 hypothetical protein [Conexibacter sp.]MDX6732353.1 hypothetical protein [Baekduia sp.]